MAFCTSFDNNVKYGRMTYEHDSRHVNSDWFIVTFLVM